MEISLSMETPTVFPVQLRVIRNEKRGGVSRAGSWKSSRKRENAVMPSMPVSLWHFGVHEFNFSSFYLFFAPARVADFLSRERNRAGRRISKPTVVSP